MFNLNSLFDSTAREVKRLNKDLRGRRRGGRAAEGARLESVYTGNRIEGSNPSPSANLPPQPALRSATGSKKRQVSRASRGEAVDYTLATEARNHSLRAVFLRSC